MNKAQILIIEDDAVFAEMVQFQLSTSGIPLENIISIDSIGEAKEIRKYQEPDVILLDLNITDSSGVETYDSIKELFPLASVIVLSGMDDESIALEIVSKGGQDYVLKGDLNAQILNKTIKYGLLRRQLSIKVQKSERKFKDVFKKSPLPIIQLVGEDMTIGLINNAAQELYKVSDQELIGKRLNSFNSGSSKDDLITSKGGRFIQRISDDTEITVDIEISQIESDSSKVEFIALIIDRTEELEFEKRKFDIISHAEESEKKKIARELHDGLGQQMVLLNLLFQNLEVQEEQKANYKELGDLLQSCIREVKEIAYNLLPPELEAGFINAMERFAHRINAIGEIEFRLEMDESIMESDMHSIDNFNLYRIIQELFNNTIKHANASVFTFKMTKTQTENISITISDNGVGFDIDDVEHGLGLANIQYRMNMSGISGKFQSEVGKGTQVNLKFN
ncbi:response regulator [Crocinitomicaceae bacterium]|nr:response regulator [Crocinitomicaceae bacterium]